MDCLCLTDFISEVVIYSTVWCVKCGVVGVVCYGCVVYSVVCGVRGVHSVLCVV